MKAIGVEQTTLDACMDEAQRERIVLTRGGHLIALVVGIEGLDAEQVQLGCSNAFWRLIVERRRQGTIDRVDLERHLVRD
jgi:hypothetical protein